MKKSHVRLSESKGFTLTELAIVLFIVALLIGGMMVPLSAQNDLRNNADTQKTLTDVRDALLGFAATQGRLPCPAAPSTTGIEAGGGAAACSTALNGVADGFVPGIALGIMPTNDKGYVLDAWGNPIRYAVTVAPTTTANTFTNNNGIHDFWTAHGGPPAPDLQVCSNSISTSISNAGGPSANCTSGNELTKSAVVVVYSLGKNAATGGASGDESHNPNPNTSVPADRVFVSHIPSPPNVPGGEFDDIVLWLSPNILYNRMIAAGQLP